MVQQLLAVLMQPSNWREKHLIKQKNSKTLVKLKSLINFLIEIVENLRLPPVKIHCSVLAEQSIKKAIEDYEKKQKLKKAKAKE